MNGDAKHSTGGSSYIEGIGRPSVEASFVPRVIDDMLQVPDVVSVAAMRWLHEHIGYLLVLNHGGEMGGRVFMVADQMFQHGHQGSLVTLMYNAGERYIGTYYNDNWVVENIAYISASSQTTAIFLQRKAGPR